ncbi:MAG: hypothetical protein IPN08_13880 [Bacteroidales bacterium]|nr:hypothetical protein [Bacteroidales bacterium]
MSDLSSNIQLSYLYRDAGNYKLFGQVIFRNPENLSLEEIYRKINVCLIDGEFFDAKKWGIPVLQFENYNKELDHFWREIEKIDATTAEITDNRSIAEFLRELQQY